MDIATIFQQAAERYPDRTALVFEGRRWTYAAWQARVARFAQALADLGVRPGDRVAFYISTSEASVTTYFACQLLGAVAVPMNFRLASEEVIHILRDSGARIFIYAHFLAENALKAAAAVRSVHDYISCGDDANEVPAGHHHFETLAEMTLDRNEVRPVPNSGDLSALIYTSGTTGRAKGVMHTHGNDVAIAMNCVMEYGLSPEDTALHIAPLYHVGGMQAFFIPHLLVGGTNVVLGRYEAAKTLDAIRKESVTTLFAVPTQIPEMLNLPNFKTYDLSSLRMMTTGGSAIAARTMERAMRELCPRIFNGYGMTEASLTLVLRPEDALAHLGSCGKPTLISGCRIVTHDSEREVPPGEIVEIGQVGQLIVRGPQVMAGYWNNPFETSRKLKAGWLYTGDLFSRDAGGYFHYRGRADDMIVTGGENVYPREVEEILHRCPGVKDVAVVGLPDAQWGQVVSAFIVPGEPRPTTEAVDRFCRRSDDLARYKRPKRIFFVERLPMNPSGKVLKRELIARYQAVSD